MSALILLIAAYCTASRNAMLILALLPWLALFARPTLPKLAAALVVPALGFALVFLAPLPHSDPTSESAVNRLLISIESARSGDANQLSGGRMPLWNTALNMGRAYPLTGCGVGTFPLLARPDSPLRAPGEVDAYGSAHSMPLHLFAEAGALSALAWIAIYVLLPWLLLLRHPRVGAFTVVLLAFGLGNVLDTMWMSAGITTFSVVLLMLATLESSEATPQH